MNALVPPPLLAVLVVFGLQSEMVLDACFPVLAGSLLSTWV